MSNNKKVDGATLELKDKKQKAKGKSQKLSQPASSTQTIGIIGLGLIGGSLGLDLRALGYRVLGVSRRATTCERAIARGAVDEASDQLASLATADVVFICTPIAAIAPTLKALVPHLKPDAVVTDVGSVKASVVENCMPLWPNFVGSHPMAGTAEQGIEAAQRELFEGAAYVLTPRIATPKDAVQVVEAIAQALGCRCYHCTPSEHDQAVAWISHLPVMISGSLIAACVQEEDRRVLELAQKLASSGFRDTSRVGGGNPELGQMMAQYNQTALLRSLHQYRELVDSWIADIEDQHWDDLHQRLIETQKARPDFVDVRED